VEEEEDSREYEDKWRKIKKWRQAEVEEEEEGERVIMRQRLFELF